MYGQHFSKSRPRVKLVKAGQFRSIQFPNEPHKTTDAEQTKARDLLEEDIARSIQKGAPVLRIDLFFAGKWKSAKLRLPWTGELIAIKEPPYLEAVLRGSQLVVKCPCCGDEHYHGAHGAGGHRAGHCELSMNLPTGGYGLNL